MNNNLKAFNRHIEFWWPGEFTEAQKREAYERLCEQAAVRAARSRGHRYYDIGGEEILVEAPQIVEHIHRTSNMSRQEFDLLQQTALKAGYLDTKVKQLFERRKPRGEY